MAGDKRRTKAATCEADNGKKRIDVRPRREMGGPGGFTLIGVIALLAVLSILAAVAIPMALRIFQVTAEDTTGNEMQKLRKALLGDPEKLLGAVRSDFGFLDDVGCLPTTALGGLDRLLTQGAYGAWSFNAAAHVGAGWKGPYVAGAAIGQEAEEFQKDQWGNAYRYTPAAGACPLTATFTSSGANGIFDGAPPAGGDDIDFSIAAVDTSATVSGLITDWKGDPVPGATVTVNYPVNGTLATASGTTNSAGAYSISGIPFGNRSVSITPKLIVTSAAALPTGTSDPDCNTAGPATCSIVEFKLVNYSTSAVPGITSLTATYAGGALYFRVKWGTAVVFNCAGSCGQGSGSRAITSSSVGAASAALSPFVVAVDNPLKELADIKIGASGQLGTAVLVRIINFRNCSGPNQNCGGSGGQVSMSGVPFTITFSDGSIIQFTPQ